MNRKEWGAAVTILAVIAVVWFALARVVPAATRAASPAVPAASYSCTLAAAGIDVEMQVTDSTSSCASWVQALAPMGLNWRIIPQAAQPYSAGTADGETMYKVCVLSSGSTALVVEDAGSAFYGNSLCSQEEANGWVPHESTDG